MQEECKVCKGSNCNNARRFVECANCTSSVECGALLTTRAARTKICPEYRDQCFTYIGKQGIERGCLSVKTEEFQEKCRGDEDKCDICVDLVDRVECNRKPFHLEFCVDCDASKDMFCRERPSLFRNKICNSVKSDAREGCYLRMVSFE